MKNYDMKRIILSFLLVLLGIGAATAKQWPGGYVRVDGPNLVEANGKQLRIRGTNLGNWLNPEGYMFGFKKVNSPHFINEMLCQLVGPDEAAAFWAQFKDRYITRDDIKFLASCGANVIRLPFHYALFTDEDFMGLTSRQDGFARIDQVVEWCREFHLYLILDMHDCPGGQTGDNIDDSYGYPWLLTSPASQQKFCDIWQAIAHRYEREPIILGYELMNEPIAHYFEEDMALLKGNLEPLQKRAVAAIRKEDRQHIILLGGAVWNSHFDCFSDWTYDDKLMYTCHRYGGEPTADAIRSYIEFRDKTQLPMYMGELGHNSDEWQSRFVETLEQNNIGWTFWPYKKLDNSCWMGIARPAEWDSIVNFAEADRSSYEAIRKARPSQALSRRVLAEYLNNLAPARCNIQHGYLKSIGLEPKKK